MTKLIWLLVRISLGMPPALVSYGLLMTNATLAIASTVPGDRSSTTLPLATSDHPPDVASEVEQANSLEITPFDNSEPLNESIEQVTSASQLVDVKPVESDNTSVLSSEVEQANSLRITPFEDLEPLNEPLAQITSVSQLVDVKSTDWAFQALQSLVERYGCGVGYPDEFFRGSRSLSRYEFAAGMSACLDQIQEVFAKGTADFIQPDDLEILKKMMEEFAPELTVLQGRVDHLDVQTATLENQQFSPTAKLSGTAIFFLGDAFGNAASDVNTTAMNYQSRLVFTASFTGADLLRFSFISSNSRLFNAGNPTIDDAQGGFGTPQRFSSSFPSAFSDETHLVSNGLSEFINDDVLRNLEISYSFPVGQHLFVTISPGTADPASLGGCDLHLIESFNSGITQ